MRIFSNIEKRGVSVLVPYRWVGEELHFYLQRRDIDAKALPDWYGPFGGGLENGESPDDGLLREIQEELVFDASEAIFFSKFEFFNKIYYVYHLEVGTDFEAKVEVREGQYGKFFSESEAEDEPKLRPHHKLILTTISEQLRKT